MPIELNSETLSGLATLLDRQAIYDCLKRYTRGVDRHDVALIRSAFWPDAMIGYGQMEPCVRNDFVDWVNLEHAKFEQNQHHITTQTVDIDGDTAHVESYVIHFLLGSNCVVGSSTIGSGRYIERYERRGGEWRILVREYIADAIFVGTTTIDLCPPETGCRGKRSSADLSYARPLEPLKERPTQGGRLPDNVVPA